MVNREKLAELIIKLRKKKGYSQRKLAMISGVSNSTVSRIESATSDTDPETLKKLAPCLDVTYETLMQAAGYIENDSSKIIIKSDEIEAPKEKYQEVHDVEEAMKIILSQPGLMLKGELLSDESKIILANAIQMGLKTVEELEKKKNKGDGND